MGFELGGEKTEKGGTNLETGSTFGVERSGDGRFEGAFSESVEPKAARYAMLEGKGDWTTEGVGAFAEAPVEHGRFEGAFADEAPQPRVADVLGAPERTEIASPGREASEVLSPRDELDMVTYTPETLEKVAADMENQSFRSGTGEQITYAAAMDRLLADADVTLMRLQQGEGRDISNDQRAAAVEEMRQAILAQQAQSESRTLGNHGIPHIYGNYERLKDTPEDVLQRAAEQVRERNPESVATADDIRMGLLLSCAYHDEGYLSMRAVEGDPDLGKRDDSMHGVDSAIAFEQIHAERLSGLVDGAVLDETTMAIAQHNVVRQADIEALRAHSDHNAARLAMLERMGGSEPKSMDPNEGFIRSALLLSDKAATDMDEKLPDAFRTPEAAEALMDAHVLHAVDVDDSSARDAERELLRDRLVAINAEREDLSEDQRERMRLAVEKDVDVRHPEDGKLRLGAYDYALPMAGMSTPVDAVSFRVGEDGKIEGHVIMRDRVDDPVYTDSIAEGGVKASDMPENIAAKKLTGQLGDMGISPESVGVSKSELLRPVDADGGSEEAQPLTGNALERVSREEVLASLYGDRAEAPPKDAGSFEVNTDNIPTLNHVVVELRDVEPESAKAEVGEAQAAMERRAEELRDIRLESERQGELIEEESRLLQSAMCSGKLCEADIAAYIAAIYDEGNRSQMDAIVAKLTEDNLSQVEMRRLAQACLDTPVLTYEERIRHAVGAKSKGE